MKFRNIEFDTKNKTYVMGILNVTPDSFSDGGKFVGANAVKHAQEMLEEGVAIIDIGGESTRPGFLPVPEDEELERVIPVIEAIRKSSDVVISVDTMKAKVARESIKAGADIINDVSFMNDKELIKVVAETKCGYCLMQNEPADFDLANRVNSMVIKASSEDNTTWTNWFIDTMENAINELKTAGVDMTKLMIDPGVGFSKGYKENLLAINAVSKMAKLGYPVLLAASRKSVIGNALDVDINNRLEGTLALTSYAVLNNCSFVRTHDIRENVRTIKMLEAIKELN